MQSSSSLDKSSSDGLPNDQSQYIRHVTHRKNSTIDSDLGGSNDSHVNSKVSAHDSHLGHMGSSGLQHRHRSVAAAEATVANTEIPFSGVSAQDGAWPGDGPEIIAGRRHALAQRRFFLQIAHFFKLLILSVIVIMLLVAVGIPVSDNGVPAAGDYSNMQFDWQLDPRSYLKPFNASFTQYNVLLDAHLHTTYSDGVLSPKQALEFALANGYNAVIVTDHQTVDGALAAKAYAEEHLQGKITVIAGMEYTCCRIHMNLIGINESIQATPPSPSDEQIKAVIDKAHAMGGLVIVNHIPWSNTTLLPWGVARLPNNPSREQLLDWGVDGFEVINQDTFDLRSYQFIQDNADKLVGLAGSDMHHPGSSYAWTTINARSMSAEDILDEIRNRRTSFLFDPSGTRPVQSPPYSDGYLRYAPWGLVGDYFYGYADRSRGQYSFQATFCQNEVVDIHNTMIGWFLLWLIVSIIALQILYWSIRWLLLSLLVRPARRWWVARRHNI
ncbi:hypothetical protein H4R99_000711 [Coemansia sp. RSA 1722]|nr:hypothetical protein LPJ57_000186 [Coemansia sp. RSA 486]KAJ2237762.1 hypothetical protein IWW45_000647 [Coemansia sp. RSA 485]KAJ2602484.1 hypothetical protein GGF39_000695 [Coemansia sp. RSA 1721]KAJ2606006.1 hypothetical protein H4R99_000711 [Coemansia sp. RSA 1722]KAJ2639604.1 hypothetical protein GGF40_000716 [Coemansia sp. RSA 1286]